MNALLIRFFDKSRDPKQIEGVEEIRQKGIVLPPLLFTTVFVKEGLTKRPPVAKRAAVLTIMRKPLKESFY